MDDNSDVRSTPSMEFKKYFDTEINSAYFLKQKKVYLRPMTKDEKLFVMGEGFHLHEQQRFLHDLCVWCSEHDRSRCVEKCSSKKFIPVSSVWYIKLYHTNMSF